jgi:8-oxo-dGTP pyrophosphatase MutT (NUDIX family)
MTGSPTIRHAARVLLVDVADRVLLFRCRDPRIDTKLLWITPGGGLIEGETHEQAGARELFEETGLHGLPMGPCVWTRSHVFKFGERMLDQRERFYLVHCGGAPEINRSGHCQDEILILEEHRWWSADEIIAAKDETFTPRRLGEFLKELLRYGAPCTPIDVGV